MKLRKYPKKPKRTASIDTLRNYLQRVKDIDKHNADVERLKNEKNKLHAQISGIGKASSHKSYKRGRR